MHRYSIDQLIAWARDGIVWYVATLVGLGLLVVVPQYPPEWWYTWWSYTDWYNGSDNNWHPQNWLAGLWLYGCWRLLETFISESATWLVSQAQTIVFSYIGLIPNWAYTLGNGLSVLFTRIGETLPGFATDVASGLSKLYAWLPNEIISGAQTWHTMWQHLVDLATDYADAIVDALSSTVTTIYNWIVNTGGMIVTWFNTTRYRVEDLVNNFRTRVLGELGTAWTRLTTFERDALTFYYNLWSTNATKLSDFISDPLQWLYSRAEDWILDRLW